MRLSKQQVVGTSAFTFSTLRSIGFSLEFLALNSLAQAFFGRSLDGDDTRARKMDVQTFKLIRDELTALFKLDSDNIGAGLYPIRVLEPESMIRHFLRIPRIMLDGYRAGRRKQKGRTTEFNRHAQEMLDELPRYYRRNFHFQTNGYLSDESAALYEHQVELLFRGAGDAMRRMLIAPAKRMLGTTDGKGLTFLEIGAGTGSATRFIRLAFPKAKIVVTDLSEPYLKAARERLSRHARIDFMQADGAKLPFQNETFDFAYSVFLHHELPFSVRQQILTESRRVTKTGGLVAALDSLQTGDKEALDILLEDFPREYHEPFYRDYISKPLEGLFHDAGIRDVGSETGFFAKLVYGRV